MRRLELLINEARLSTNTTDIASVSTSLCQAYMNRIGSYMEDLLFLANSENDLFISDFLFNLIPGQDEYDLPTNIYAKSSIDNLAVSFLNGLSNTFLPLKKISRKQLGFTFGYFIREDKIVLSPRPTSPLRMRMAYVRKLPTLGIRQGSAISGTSKAFKTIQDIKYTANETGTNGNLINITYNKGVKSSLVAQDITFEAVNYGTSGDNISIKYIVGATSGNEIVSVAGNAITIKIEDAVSTATDILAKIVASTPALLLISASITGTGSNPQSVFAATNLSGGVNFASAGSEIVSVVGNSIVITIEDGVSTASQIANSVNLSQLATNLISVLITGTGSNTQTIASIVYLSGGINSLTIGAQTSDLVSDYADFFCTVDSNGNILSSGNKILSYTNSTGVFTFTKGSGDIQNGQYVILGKYATSHSQLPDECEKYLIIALERMIQYRQSSSDIRISQLFSEEELVTIKEVFADNSYDDAKPPVTEFQEWLP
jgi:hypothetical protein